MQWQESNDKILKFSKFIYAIKLYYKIPQINVFLILALKEAGVLSRNICIIMTKFQGSKIDSTKLKF